ncbi:BEL1-like homeodomain protein 1 [Musa acuminata AAA Group]|uniref:BEL1-like homeodomain protein 1 n=1 Tax=Musa acuminata AAA Group TaxID=214697 RepID=UPI0031DC502D
MATYFHGAPEIQPDGLQTLYLMNPSYVGYSDAAAPANMVLLNSTLNSMNPINLAQASQPNHHQQQQFVGIPLQTAAQPHESYRPPPIHAPHDLSAAVQGLIPRLHYNLWTPATSSNPVDMASQFGPRRPSAVPSAQQGLSLSLSPHDMVAPAPEITPASANGATTVASASMMPGAANGASGSQSFLMGSKYLKAAQQLLDEVVNVEKGIKSEPAKGATSKDPADSSNAELKCLGAGATDDNSKEKQVADLTTAERQELQMKKAKLINMLDEVEQRYRQYHHQMQIVISSFEAVAGYGSARTYTALALRTISKQFRCLRDAITGQIQATSKSLGEEESKSGGSRLRFIDHHLRQQRALQQLGMIQPNAWRPQRGLPERSVSVLRAWLFEHFLHPYPKDSDKMMLAKQTGLTRSQVSNWFINARVRLWKPMVEEMYLEEIKDQEQNNSDENASKSDAHGSSTSKSNAPQEGSPTGTPPSDSLKNDLKQTLASVQPSSFVHGQNQAYYDRDAIAQPRVKRARSNDSPHVNPMANPLTVGSKPDETSNHEILMQLMDGRQGVGEQGYPLLAGTTSHGGNYGAYPMGELRTFDAEHFSRRFSGNGVSLTLGLQHSGNLPLSGAQASLLSSDSMRLGRRLETSSEGSDYCSLNHNTAAAHSSNAAFRADRGLLLNYYQAS